MSGLKEKFESKIEPLREEFNNLVKNHGDKVISEVTIAQACGGIRGVKCLLCDTSSLDPMEGIQFRGYNIPQLCEKLPKAPGGEQPLPEGLFYLLLTGDLPSENDVKKISEEWSNRGILPDYLISILEALPKDMHPMTQYSLGIESLQKESVFARRYKEGMKKTDYWDPTYEDSMSLLAKLPSLAAYIYRRTYKGGDHIPVDSALDWGGNFAHMMGVENPEYKELMRLYLFLHSDHESGNVSAHTTHVVGSSLSDVYYSLSAGINGLAGPLHGLANQEALRWIMEMREKLGGGGAYERTIKAVSLGHIEQWSGHSGLWPRGAETNRPQVYGTT